MLPVWREMRARVEGAPLPPAQRELQATLRHYLAERQTAWEAYSAALRAPSEGAAREHYDAYHEHSAAATRDARSLGEAFARMR